MLYVKPTYHRTAISIILAFFETRSVFLVNLIACRSLVMATESC